MWKIDDEILYKFISVGYEEERKKMKKKIGNDVNLKNSENRLRRRVAL